MRVKFVSFLFDDDLSLKKLGVIVEKSAFQSGSLSLHGIKLFLSGFPSLLLKVVPVSIVRDLIFKLAYVASATS